MLWVIFPVKSFAECSNIEESASWERFGVIMAPSQIFLLYTEPWGNSWSHNKIDWVKGRPEKVAVHPLCWSAMLLTDDPCIQNLLDLGPGKLSIAPPQLYVVNCPSLIWVGHELISSTSRVAFGGSWISPVRPQTWHLAPPCPLEQSVTGSSVGKTLLLGTFRIALPMPWKGDQTTLWRTLNN